VKYKENGIANMLLAALCLATMGALTKILGKRFSSVELVFFRNSIGTAIICISFLIKPIRQEGGKFLLLAFRGLIGASSLFAFFYCLTKLQLAVANTYNLTYPIFIGIISVLILKKKLGLIQWIGISIGFAGVLFVFHPDLTFPLKFHLLGVYTGIATAIGYITVNQLSRIYDRRVIVLSFLVTGLFLSVISMIAGLYYQNPDLDFILSAFTAPQGTEWLLLLLMGTIALLAQTFITRAFSFGKPGVVGPINFMQIPFAMIYGLLLGDFLPNIYSAIGIALILGSGVLITIFSNKME
jgi:drug/metabolite transporter (DMT)-like permease